MIQWTSNSRRYPSVHDQDEERLGYLCLYLFLGMRVAA